VTTAETLMRTVNMREAKTHLSRLVKRAAKGEGFIIARAGTPLVKVVPLDARDTSMPRRLGLLVGEIAVPDDFDRMGQDEIERQFGISSR
jgi:prevent-host-death family protein